MFLSEFFFQSFVHFLVGSLPAAPSDFSANSERSKQTPLLCTIPYRLPSHAQITMAGYSALPGMSKQRVKEFMEKPNPLVPSGPHQPFKYRTEALKLLLAPEPEPERILCPTNFGQPNDCSTVLGSTKAVRVHMINIHGIDIKENAFIQCGQCSPPVSFASKGAFEAHDR